MTRDKPAPADRHRGRGPGPRQATPAACVALLSIAIASVAAGSTSREVLATGSADAAHTDAHRLALEDAIRNAVREAAGVERLDEAAIDRLIAERGGVLAACEGSIASWSVRDRRVRDGRLELTAAIRFQPGTLREELMETAFDTIDTAVLYEWVGKPRVVVALEETMDGEADRRRMGTATLEDELINRSVDVFSREQVEAMIDRDRRLALDRPAEAARLGEQLGADLVLTGTFTTDFSRETPPLKIGSTTVQHVFYTSYIQLRLIESATGRILLSKNWDNSDPGEADLGRMGKHDAAIVSKQHLASRRTPDLIGAIAEAWRKSLLDGQRISVQIQGAAAADLAALDRALGDVPRMAESRRRGFVAGGAATYDVRYRGQQAALEEALAGLRGPRLALERSDRGAIALRVRPAPAKSEPAGAVRVVAVDPEPAAVARLEAWVRSQAEVTRVERDPEASGSLRAFTGGTLTSGELFRRLTSSAAEFDAVGLDRDSLQVRAGRESGAGG